MDIQSIRSHPPDFGLLQLVFLLRDTMGKRYFKLQKIVLLVSNQAPLPRAQLFMKELVALFGGFLNNIVIMLQEVFFHSGS